LDHASGVFRKLVLFKLVVLVAATTSGLFGGNPTFIINSGNKDFFLMQLSNLAASWQPRLLSLLRIVTALLLLQHGTAKLFGFPHVAMFDGLTLFSLLGVAGILEFFGGLLLLLGLFTRPVAFVLSGFTATAYFIAHAQKSFFPILNQGELAVLYCFVLLYLAAAGGGAFSLDNRRARIRNGSMPPSV
jgi:putative oxidoreductase